LKSQISNTKPKKGQKPKLQVKNQNSPFSQNPNSETPNPEQLAMRLRRTHE
jgi:hypothetical protein